MSLTPELVLQAYHAGVFPMADHRNDADILWIEPVERGVIELHEFHVPKRLQRFINRDIYDVRFDTNFAAVINACAQRPETWINHSIESVYNELHKMGHAHSVETYTKDGMLVGGLYGLALGGLFCGESMFSKASNASKVALVALVERLKERKFMLLDTQFITDHLQQFGTKTVPQETYLRLARIAIEGGVPVGF